MSDQPLVPNDEQGAHPGEEEANQRVQPPEETAATRPQSSTPEPELIVDETLSPLEELAEQLGVKYISRLDPGQLDPEVVGMIAEETATSNNIIAVQWDVSSKTLTVAISDAPDLNFEQMLPHKLEGVSRVEWVIADRRQIELCIRDIYHGSPLSLKTLPAVHGELPLPEIQNSTSMGWVISDPPNAESELVVQLAEEMILRALQNGASDLALAPDTEKVHAIIRVYGEWLRLGEFDNRVYSKILNVIKGHAGLDIDRLRGALDGSVGILYQGIRFDGRLNVAASRLGESLTIRILDSRDAKRTINDLGLSPVCLKRLPPVLNRPDGVTLVTGPTGSGKTSSLYAMLQYALSMEHRVVTIEDPVEYVLGGGVIQLTVTKDLPFEKALRAALRQVPQTIMIGEIRDRESAEIAMNAARTGHQVFSTLHTNDAAGAVVQLLQMGIQPWAITGALQAVLAQRLVRKLCRSCRVQESLHPDQAQQFGFTDVDPQWGISVYASSVNGCTSCSRGYTGLIPVNELLLVDTPDINKVISGGAERVELLKAIEKQGMVTMLQDGWTRVAAGTTSAAEVLRVVPS